jgi:hypothetical protein
VSKKDRKAPEVRLLTSYCRSGTVTTGVVCV